MAPQYRFVQPSHRAHVAADPQNGVRVERQPSGRVGSVCDHSSEHDHPVEHGLGNRWVAWIALDYLDSRCLDTVRCS